MVELYRMIYTSFHPTSFEEGWHLAVFILFLLSGVAMRKLAGGYFKGLGVVLFFIVGSVLLWKIHPIVCILIWVGCFIAGWNSKVS